MPRGQAKKPTKSKGAKPAPYTRALDIRAAALARLNANAAKARADLLAAKNIKLLETRYQIVTMRKNGYSMRDICMELKLSADAVRSHLQTLLSDLATKLSETTEEARQLEILRYDALLKRYLPAAEAGSVPACQMVLQIEAARRKLLALDVPETRKLDVTGVREYVGIDMDQV